MEDHSSPASPKPTVDSEYADRLIRAMNVHRACQEQSSPSNSRSVHGVAPHSHQGRLRRAAPYAAGVAGRRGVRTGVARGAGQTRSVVSGGGMPRGERGDGGDDGGIAAVAIDDNFGFSVANSNGLQEDANSNESRNSEGERGKNNDNVGEGVDEEGDKPAKAKGDKEDKVAEVKGDKNDSGAEGEDGDEEDDDEDKDEDAEGEDRSVGSGNSGRNKTRVPKPRTVIQTAPVWVIRNNCPVLVCGNKFPDEKNRDLIGRHLRWAMKSGKLQNEHAEQHRIWTAAGGKLTCIQIMIYHSTNH